MSKKTILIMGAVAALVAMPAASHAGFWSIATGSGYLSEGISDNGVASGGAGGYFVWTSGTGAIPIGGTAPGGGVGGQGKISNDGTRISGTYLNPASGLNEAAYFDVNTGVWNPIGGIGGFSGAEMSSGWSITGDGQNVVGLGWEAGGNAHAIIGNLGGATDLGSNDPLESSRANGADYDGNVVVGWQDGPGRQGAAWVNGVQELITLPGGGIAQEAYAVTNDGTWVTGLGLGSFFSSAVTYRYNTVTNTTETIPNLAVGAESRMAGTAITDDGSLIVGGTWGLGPATLGKAIVWEEGVGTSLFSDYLDGLGVSYPAGYSFAFVSDVSSDGQWFTGWGNGGSGLESWVVNVPEPATMVLLGMGAIAVLRRRH